MRHEKQPGYTLGQLLATLVIINLVAFFVGAVIASLRQASDYAKEGRCSSNLRQIAAGMLMYSSDYDETFPPCAMPSNKADVLQGWAAPHDTNGTATQNNDAGLSLVGPYLKNERLFHCPKEEPSQNADHLDSVSYMVNDLAAGVARKYFSAPQNTVLVCDGENFAGNVGHSYNPNGPIQPPSFTKNGRVISGAVLQKAPTRHGGEGIYGFADGHVLILKPSAVFFPLAANLSRSHEEGSNENRTGQSFGPSPTELPNKQWRATFHIK